MKKKELLSLLLLCLFLFVLLCGCGVPTDMSKEDSSQENDKFNHPNSFIEPDEVIVPKIPNGDDVLRRIGNTNSNLIGGSNIAADNEWLYYSPNQLYYDVGYTGEYFYRMKHDSSEATLLSDINASDINLYGEWTYFIGNNAMQSDLFGYFESQGIFKMRKDGNELTTILQEKDVRSLIIVDEWLYFLNSSGQLYKMEPDGSGITLLDEREEYNALQYDNGYLYYYSWHTDKLSRVYLANKPAEPEDFGASFGRCPLIDNSWIYYNDTNGLVRVQFDGSHKQIILPSQSELCGFVISDGFIFIIETKTDNHTESESMLYIWKINITEIDAEMPPASRKDVKWQQKGWEETIQAHLTGAMNGYLYTLEYEGGDLFHLYRLRYDGTDYENVEHLIHIAMD